VKNKTEILPFIVDKASKGDGLAQKELYQLFCKAMYSICIRMVENRQDAEDILQDAFVHAFKSLSKLKDQHLFPAWLKRIVINECIKHLKKDVRWYNLGEYIGDDHSEEVEGGWFANISLEQVYREIKMLPYGCRQIFSLYAIEDYSHKEIATLLNISESTSKSQYQRAKKILRYRLIKVFDKNGPI
jgi:RNA polymerase sigma factor (sigma-70 family)